MYTEKGIHLNFFIPNIALAENAAEVLKEMDIGASSSSLGEFLCVRACLVRKLQFTLTGELAGGTSVAPIVAFKKRPTPKSSSGASTVGTLTIPDATAIGITVYKNVTPVAFAVGDSMELSWTVGTGTPTGIGFCSFICDEQPESPANNSEMLASV